MRSTLELDLGFIVNTRYLIPISSPFKNENHLEQLYVGNYLAICEWPLIHIGVIGAANPFQVSLHLLN